MLVLFLIFVFIFCQRRRRMRGYYMRNNPMQTTTMVMQPQTHTVVQTTAYPQPMVVQQGVPMASAQAYPATATAQAYPAPAMATASAVPVSGKAGAYNPGMPTATAQYPAAAPVNNF